MTRIAVRSGPLAAGPLSSAYDPVDVMLVTRFPVVLMGGPDLVMVDNQAYVDLIADKHPAALGSPARAVFPEAWNLIGPMLQGVLDGDGATYVADELVPLDRSGFLEECCCTFSYSPVHDVDGDVEGSWTSPRRAADLPAVDLHLPGAGGSVGAPVLAEQVEGGVVRLPRGATGAPGSAYLAVRVGTPTSPADPQSSKAPMTASSIVCLGPVNQCFAETCHQIASTSSVPKVRIGA